MSVHEPCPFESEIKSAARSGQWNPELIAHRDGCLSCAELTLVTAALAADADELLNDPRPLPDPSILWLRARLTAREYKLDKATRAIAVIQRATIAAAAAVGIFFAPGLWRLVTKVIGALDMGASVAQLPRAAGSPLLVLVMSMVVLGGLALWELTASEG